MTVDPPFDFGQSAGLFASRMALPDIFEKGIYYRALYVEDTLALVLASSEGTTQSPAIRFEVYPKLDKSKINFLKAILRIMFASSPDFERFSSVARKDRLMRIISKELLGLRPIAPPTLFEALVIGITEQQISLDAALAIRSKLVMKYGETVQFNGRIYHAFPTPKALANANRNGLRSVGLSKRKVEYVSELSRRLSSGKLDIERLRELDDELAVDALMSIRGIGRWTAEYVLIRGMARINSLPADDLGIQRAVSRAYFRGMRVTSEDVRRILRKFTPCSGIAAFYLMYYLFWKRQPQ
jgi:DNA-3-methyladenine glycosylase II